MTTNIGLDCINSYKKLSTLKTDKKVNLIYGLNGTRKSTLTNFLYDIGSSKRFSKSIMNKQNEEKESSKIQEYTEANSFFMYYSNQRLCILTVFIAVFFGLFTIEFRDKFLAHIIN